MSLRYFFEHFLCNFFLSTSTVVSFFYFSLLWIPYSFESFSYTKLMAFQASFMGVRVHFLNKKDYMSRGVGGIRILYNTLVIGNN